MRHAALLNVQYVNPMPSVPQSESLGRKNKRRLHVVHSPRAIALAPVSLATQALPDGIPAFPSIQELAAQVHQHRESSRSSKSSRSSSNSSSGPQERFPPHVSPAYIEYFRREEEQRRSAASSEALTADRDKDERFVPILIGSAPFGWSRGGWSHDRDDKVLQSEITALAAANPKAKILSGHYSGSRSRCLSSASDNSEKHVPREGVPVQVADGSAGLGSAVAEVRDDSELPPIPGPNSALLNEVLAVATAAAPQVRDNDRIDNDPAALFHWLRANYRSTDAEDVRPRLHALLFRVLEDLGPVPADTTALVRRLFVTDMVAWATAKDMERRVVESHRHATPTDRLEAAAVVANNNFMCIKSGKEHLRRVVIPLLIAAYPSSPQTDSTCADATTTATSTNTGAISAFFESVTTKDLDLLRLMQLLALWFDPRCFGVDLNPPAFCFSLGQKKFVVLPHDAFAEEAAPRDLGPPPEPETSPTNHSNPLLPPTQPEAETTHSDDDDDGEDAGPFEADAGPGPPSIPSVPPVSGVPKKARQGVQWRDVIQRARVKEVAEERLVAKLLNIRERSSQYNMRARPSPHNSDSPRDTEHRRLSIGGAVQLSTFLKKMRDSQQ